MFNDCTVTEEAKAIKEYIESKWGRHFTVELEIRLGELFQEPENKGLKHIWRYGSADVVVKQNGKCVAIIEPGGSHHFEEHQSLNDRRKYKLCEINGVRCLHLMNGVVNGLSRRKWRNLIGGYLFGRANAGNSDPGEGTPDRQRGQTPDDSDTPLED